MEVISKPRLCQRSHNPETLAQGDYQALAKAALRKAFPEVKNRRAKRRLYRLVSDDAAYELRRMVLADPSLIGQTRTAMMTGAVYESLGIYKGVCHTLRHGPVVDLVPKRA